MSSNEEKRPSRQTGRNIDYKQFNSKGKNDSSDPTHLLQTDNLRNRNEHVSIYQSNGMSQGVNSRLVDTNLNSQNHQDLADAYRT